MDSLETARSLMGAMRMEKSESQSPTKTTTVTGVATSDSADGVVTVNLEGDSVTYDDVQEIEVNTTVRVKEGDSVMISLVGADGTAKTPTVIGIVGGGDRQQESHAS